MDSSELAEGNATIGMLRNQRFRNDFRASLPTEELGPLQTSFGQLLPQRRRCCDLLHGAGDALHVIGIEQEPRLPHHFRQRRVVSTNDWGAASHCLQRRKAEPFETRQTHEAKRVAVKGGEIDIFNKASQHERCGGASARRPQVPFAIVQASSRTCPIARDALRCQSSAPSAKPERGRLDPDSCGSPVSPRSARRAHLEESVAPEVTSPRSATPSAAKAPGAGPPNAKRLLYTRREGRLPNEQANRAMRATARSWLGHGSPVPESPTPA